MKNPLYFIASSFLVKFIQTIGLGYGLILVIDQSLIPVNYCQFENFFTDTKFCIQAADGILVLVDGVDGVKVQTEQAWDFAAEFGQPLFKIKPA